MDVAAILTIFRMVATEFSQTEDAVVTGWITLTAPLVSRRKFEGLYNQALALLTAHRMKMANAGLVDSEAGDPMGEVSDIGVGNLMRVAKYTEGKTSIGFNTNITQYTAPDAELALTEYGIQYLSLRRMRIMPIVSAAEPIG